MPRIESGAGTSGQANVRPNFTLPVSLVPTEGGQYSAGWETTSLAFTNNVVVWDFRNPTANLVLVTTVKSMVTQMALAAGAAGGLRNALQLFVGRSYTALSNTNRTALTLTTNNCKLRTSYSTSGMEIGFANNVAGITGGTVTEDATALHTQTNSIFNEATGPVAANLNSRYPTAEPLFWEPSPYEGPIVLAQNEGIRLRYLVTTAAAVIISGKVKWGELGTTVYP